MCEHAEAVPYMAVGRRCRLDNSACFNYDKPELVEKCPTKKRRKREER